MGLGENFVTDFEIDAKGSLWVASAFGGIDVLNPADLTIIERHRANNDNKNGLLSNWVRSLCWAGQNELWIATYYGISFYNLASRSFSNLTKNPLFPDLPLNASCIDTDGQGNIVVGVENQGVLILNPLTKKTLYAFTKKQLGIDETLPFKLFSVYQYQPGILLLCTSHGVRLIQSFNSIYLPVQKTPESIIFFENKEVKCFFQDAAKTLFVGTNEGLYITNADGTNRQWIHSQLQRNGALLDNNIEDFFLDSFGNFWVITKKGLNRLEKRKYEFAVYNKDDLSGNVLEHVNSLYPHNSSTLLVSASSGLYTADLPSGRFDLLFPVNSYGFIWDILKVKEHTYILSAEKELLLMNTRARPYTVNKISSVFPELLPIQHNYFNAMVPVGDSLVLFGSEEEKGLFVWNKNHGKLTHFYNQKNNPEGIFADHIQNISKDRRGNIWIISDECLSLFDPNAKTFRHYFPSPGTKGKLNSYFLFDLYDDGRYIWLTSYGGGLNRFDVEAETFSAITEQDGLTSNCTYCVLPESDSILWVSSNNGLNRINTNNSKIEPYFYNDGLQSSAFDTKSGCKIRDTLFFGGVDGFTKITKAVSSQFLTHFPVYISGVDYYEKNELKKIHGIVSASLDFKAGVDLISFYISALGFANGNRYTYEYRVEGITNDWVSISNQNSLTLAGLAAGEYRLQVRAQVNKGPWNESKRIDFTIRHFWYQTWIFKALLSVLALGGIFALYRYRISQLKKQHQIRREIAADLHDDIGSTLNAVKLFTHLAQRENSNRSHLQKIEEFLLEATTSLRDMIWVLDNSEDTVQELFERIKKFAAPVANANGICITYSSDVDEHQAKLTKTEKRNLLLIAKETINNAIKHSNCGRIGIHIVKQKNKCTLSIFDDGKGLSEASSTDGNGLRNIRKRAQQINYQLKINSSPDSGTQIIVVKR